MDTEFYGTSNLYMGGKHFEIMLTDDDYGRTSNLKLAHETNYEDQSNSSTELLLDGDNTTFSIKGNSNVSLLLNNEEVGTMNQVSKLVADKFIEENVLTTNEDGVVNKSELSIGNFKIKGDKPFNYTLSGSLQYDYYSIDFVAEWDKGPAKYVEQEWYNYYYEQEGVYRGYVYIFVITGAASNDENEWSSEYYIGQEITVPAYIIDSDYGDYYEETLTGDSYVTHLDFSESNSHVITLPYCGLQNYESENYWPLECTITESAPFALRKISKATLNGKPIVTTDALASTESNIIKDINNKLENFVSTSKSVTSSISIDESGESYKTIKSTTSFSNGGTYLKMGYTHDVLDDVGHDVRREKTSSITNNKDGIIMSNERSGSDTDLWSGFVDADKSQVKVLNDSISFIVDDYEVTYSEDSGEPDSYIVRPKTVKLDKKSFTYNNKQIATENYVDNKIAALVDSAPETLNTLNELATAIQNNEDVVEVLNESITNKANKSEVETALKNKADKTYVEALEARIAELETIISTVFREVKEK